jgi:hypothetical protein
MEIISKEMKSLKKAIFSIVLVMFFLVFFHLTPVVKAQEIGNSNLAYDNRNNCIHIEYPFNWIVRDYKPDLKISITSDDENATASIQTFPHSVMNPPDYAKNYAGSAVKNYQSNLNNFKMIDAKPIDTIGTGFTGSNDIFAHPDAFQITYTYNDDSLGPLKVMEVFVSNNTPYDFFDLQFMSNQDTFSNYLDVFQQMISSFYASHNCKQIME